MQCRHLESMATAASSDVLDKDICVFQEEIGPS